MASSLIRERLEKLKPKDLEQDVSGVWSSISAGYFDFTLERHDAEVVEKLAKDNMVKFYKEHILPSSTVRSKVAAYLGCKSLTETQLQGIIREEWMKSFSLVRTEDGDGDEVEVSALRATLFTDVAEFKSTMKVMEAPQPVKDMEQFEDLVTKVE